MEAAVILPLYFCFGFSRGLLYFKRWSGVARLGLGRSGVWAFIRRFGAPTETTAAATLTTLQLAGPRRLRLRSPELDPAYSRGQTAQGGGRGGAKGAMFEIGSRRVLNLNSKLLCVWASCYVWAVRYQNEAPKHGMQLDGGASATSSRLAPAPDQSSPCTSSTLNLRAKQGSLKQTSLTPKRQKAF